MTGITQIVRTGSGSDRVNVGNELHSTNVDPVATAPGSDLKSNPLPRRESVLHPAPAAQSSVPADPAPDHNARTACGTIRAQR